MRFMMRVNCGLSRDVGVALMEDELTICSSGESPIVKNRNGLRRSSQIAQKMKGSLIALLEGRS